MNDDERKPRLHIHTGGLIIFIIILLILFKVDIKSKVESPQFQKNINYIEEKVKDFWKDFVLDPLKIKTNGLLIDLTNKGAEKLQENIKNNLLQPNISGELEEEKN